MDIKQAHENWTELGKDDPMWVVLTDPAKKGNRWDEHEFFETGRHTITEALKSVKQRGIELNPGRALDFGCGLGRLTQALAGHFQSVDGVDISESMIAQANRLNRHPGKVVYHLNVKPDLSAFSSASYDFIYSLIALQHTPTKFQLGYIADFVRLLKPGGAAYFQTIHALGWRRLIPHAGADLYRKFKHKGKAFIPMYAVPTETIRRTVESQGGEIRHHDSSPYSESASRYAQDYYLVIRRP